MKITAIILLSVCLTAGANGFSQTVTLTEKNVSLDKVFREIKKQTGYNFIYNDSWLANANRVSVSVKNVPLKSALDLCFKDQPFSYTIIDKTIALKHTSTQVIKTGNNPKPIPLIEIKGRIINETGAPVIASVIVKGSNMGTSTDANGWFELSGVNENASLLISGINIISTEIKVNGKTELLIEVKTRILESEEVTISTGYQKIPKERATGSFAIVDNEKLSRSVGGNIIDRIEGVASGVLFFNSLQQSLNDRENVRIRSRNTILSDATALIVLDDFPYEGDLSNINPDDVSNITILKDAAATSIWGARASNGVIVITTKSGKLQKKISVSLNSNIDFRAKQDFYLVPTINSSDLIDLQMDLYSKGAYTTTINSTSKLPLPAVVEILLKRDAGTITNADANELINGLRNNDIRKDLEKHFYQRPVFHRQSLNLSGGGNNNTFYLSAGWDKNLSEKVGDAYSRVTLNGRNNFYFLDKRLEAGISIKFSQASTDRNSESFSGFNIYDQLVDDFGNHANVSRYRNSFIDTAGAGTLLDWNYSPLDEIKLKDYNTTQIEYLTGLQIKYKITPSLDIQLNYRFERAQNETNNYDSKESYVMRDLINKFSSVDYSTGIVTRPVPLGGRLNKATQLSKRHYGRVMAHYGRTWADQHAFDIMAGADISSNRVEGSSAYFYGYEKGKAISIPVNYATAYRSFVNGTNQLIPSGISISGRTNRAVDVFSNASYSYKGKYTFTASIRQDGANIYGVRTNQKWVPLWHTGLKWNIQKESFFNIGWVSSLVLRVTHGYTGNSNTSISAYLTTLTRSPNNYNVPFSQIQTPPNPSLRWEKTGNTNIGLDAGFINNRIQFTIEYYRNKSIDLFGEAPMDPTTGIATFNGNVAAMKGSGLDLTIHTDNLKGELSWKTMLLFSKATDIITKYYFPATTQNNLVNGSEFREGKPVNSIYSYRWGGLTATGDPSGYLDKDITTDYRAIANSRSLDETVFHGSSVPVLSGSLLNTFKFKNVELSFLILYKGGYYFRKNSNLSTSNGLNGTVLSADYYLRWQRPGDEQHTSFPSLIYPENSLRNAFMTFSEVFKDKADHIRLQDIRIGYDFMKNNLPWLPVEHIQLFGRVSNAGLLWKANRWGVDPEVSQYPYLLGVNYGRNFAVGVSVDF